MNLFSSLPMLTELLFLLVFGLPFVTGIALLLGWRVPTITRFASISVFPAFVVGLSCANQHVTVDYFLLGSQFRLDEISQIYLLFTTVLWFISIVYAEFYFEECEKKRWFFFFFLLAASGNLGVIVAADMVSFYLFFALMSFSSYGLVVSERSAKAFFAGRVYIAFVIFGELLLFTASLLIVNQSDTISLANVPQAIIESPFQQLIIGLLIVGFGIKAGLLGLHVWLPLAHSVSPTPASAVLSGAMIKVGVFGWLVFLPLGSFGEVAEGMFYNAGILLIGMGLSAAFYGVVMGLGQQAPKPVLAYSSVSQMGLVTLLFGCSMIGGQSEFGVIALVLFVVHHGLAKTALFLGVGVVHHMPKQNAIQPNNLIASNQDADKAVPVNKIVWGAVIFLCLTLAGAPLTGGMVAKYLLKSQVAELVSLSTGAVSFLTWSLYISSIGTLLLLLKFLVLLWRDWNSHPVVPAQDSSNAGKGHKSYLFQPMTLIWLLLVLISFSYMFWVPSVFGFEAWKMSVLLKSTAPLLAGVLLSMLAQYGFDRFGVKYPIIKTGDVLHWVMPGAAKLLDSFTKYCINQLPVYTEKLRVSVNMEGWLNAVNRRARTIEQASGSWGVAAILILIFGAVLVLTFAIAGADGFKLN